MSRGNLIRLTLVLLVFVVCAIAYQGTAHLPEAQRIVWRLPIFLVGGGVLGVVVVAFVVPALGDQIGQFFYSAPEKPEQDAGAKARALVAQGEYEAAVEAYLDVARALPDDRLPVVEAMRLARERLGDSRRAVGIVEWAVQEREWPEDDAAFFMFRLVEMYDEDLQDRERAIILLGQIVETFPETRHAANALHKLREWHVAAAEASSQK